ncbi:hypothetical protein FA15DRAFT_591725, partial [Coprinopsis marcescibilis]
VMGPTGAGKSTFIANLLDNNNKKPNISHGLQSCTQAVSHFVMQVPQALLKKYPQLHSRRIVLVDTPGFDDTDVSDYEILRRVAAWVASSQIKVGAVLYIYPITSNRITNNDRTNLEIFNKLCGTETMSKVMLATSKWNNDPYEKEICESREKELTEKFWLPLKQQGAKHGRLVNSVKSANSLLDKMVEQLVKVENTQGPRENEFGTALAVQIQLIDKGRNLPQTAAAQELRKKLDALLKEQKASGNTESVKQKAQELIRQLEDLKLSFGDRLKMLFA